MSRLTTALALLLIVNASLLATACFENPMARAEDEVHALGNAVERDMSAGQAYVLLTSHLVANPEFYGAAIAMVDDAGQVVASPYVHQTGRGFRAIDLSLVPGYDVGDQAWFRRAVTHSKPVWTQPYYDHGGGEIWMVTLTYAISDGLGIFAVVTTDLPYDAP